LATLARDLEIARGWKKKAEIIKEVTAGIQNEQATLTAKHDELVNKCVQMEKERVQIKTLAKSRMVSDKEMIYSLKKKGLP